MRKSRTQFTHSCKKILYEFPTNILSFNFSFWKTHIFRRISSQLTFLYDTGAQISCLSTRTFRQIPIEYRPRKLNIHLNASGANGGRLKILGCYMLDITILGKRIQHPFFVCDLKKNQAILGVDIIRRLGLCFDAVSNVPYFSNPPPVAKAARLAKEVYLPPRSGTLCPINT